MKLHLARVALMTIVALSATVSAARGQSCSGDVNGDGVVDGVDLATVLAAWGNCPPRISQVTPLQGSFSGGTVITVTGSGLGSVTGVTVGGNPCTSVSVLSPTSVRATTPPGAVGQAAIVVTSPQGTALSATPFTYTEQAIVSLSPHSGPFQGGTAVTISGQGLAGTTSVTFGGVPATGVSVVSPTQVLAVTPPGSIGTVEVAVSGPWGTFMAPGGFSYVNVIVPPWASLLEVAPDPDVVTSPTPRAAIAATGYAWRVRHNATQIEMVLIPPGTFQMGCSAGNCECYTRENPVHPVTLTGAFYLGRYEVTQAQWISRMGSNPSQFQGGNYPNAANRPVDSVTWNSISGFLSSAGLRFPTEAEWEFAYRAGTTAAFHGYPGNPGGTNEGALADVIGWSSSNSPNQTRPVGQLAQNGFGLYDMAGNVWEFVSDWYSNVYYASSPSVNPPGPSSGTTRVLRGGSWYDPRCDCRASRRAFEFPQFPRNDYGFRVARNP